MTSAFINKELKVQFPAVDWLKSHWGYREIKSGEEKDALCSPIDSIGLMDGRTLLLEVKDSVGRSIVRHDPNSSGSIEGKIARALKGLHEGREDLIWPAIRQTWHPSRPPVFVLLARTYSETGRREAAEVFQHRSSEWLFDYRIWQWTGTEVRELARGELNPPPLPEQYATLDIPIVTGRSKRKRPLPLQSHREEVQCRGLLHLFDYTVKRAVELGYVTDTSRSTVRLRAESPNGPRENAIGIYIHASSEHNGMNFGFYWKRSDISEQHLPGRPAPKCGPLNITNRYIRTFDEAECALKMFAPLQPAGN